MIRRLLGCGLLGIAVLLAGCKEESLLQNLDQSQANEVVAVLQRHNIGATKKGVNKGEFSIRVSGGDFAAAVDILKAYDLPSSKPVQVADMFPTDSLVASPRAEKARMVSAIEQRLEQSLRTINGIVSARVHISYDMEAKEGRKSGPVHISALASHDGSIVAQTLVNDIKRILKNSVADVDYDNVSVVLARQIVLQHEAPRSSQQAQAGANVYLLGGGGILAVGMTGLLAWYVRRRKLENDGGDAGNPVVAAHDGDNAVVSAEPVLGPVLDAELAANSERSLKRT